MTKATGALGRRAWTFALFLIVLCGFAVAQAVAAPGTQVWTGQAAGSTPDIEQGGYTIFDASGAPIGAPGAQIIGTLNFTLDGTPYVGFCTDTAHLFNAGTTPVDSTVQDPPASPAARAAAWILLNRTPSGAATPAKQRQAVVSQVAVWILTDPDINVASPTSDASINADATALVAEATAATATPATIAVSAAAPAAGATSATVTITGRPGAVVALSITSGSGTLSAPTVTLGPSGTGTVTLSTTGPGTVRVAAATAGDGRYIAIEPADRDHQATAAAQPTSIAASTDVTFAAAPAVTGPGVVSPLPTVPVAGRVSPRIAISKTGPVRSRVLHAVRYRITVKNIGSVVARNVVLRDKIPGGLSFVRATRARTLRNGVLTFRLGNLAPHHSRTVIVTLRANARVRGIRINVATARATRARTVRATAATLFRPLVTRVQPAVTG
jgi:uncharacterized repeat protein (TIGR01451 family)